MVTEIKKQTEAEMQSTRSTIRENILITSNKVILIWQRKEILMEIGDQAHILIITCSIVKR